MAGWLHCGTKGYWGMGMQVLWGRSWRVRVRSECMYAWMDGGMVVKLIGIMCHVMMPALRCDTTKTGQVGVLVYCTRPLKEGFGMIPRTGGVGANILVSQLSKLSPSLALPLFPASEGYGVVEA